MGITNNGLDVEGGGVVVESMSFFRSFFLCFLFLFFPVLRVRFFSSFSFLFFFRVLCSFVLVLLRYLRVLLKFHGPIKVAT